MNDGEKEKKRAGEIDGAIKERRGRGWWWWGHLNGVSSLTKRDKMNEDERMNIEELKR